MTSTKILKPLLPIGLLPITLISGFYFAGGFFDYYTLFQIIAKVSYLSILAFSLYTLYLFFFSKKIHELSFNLAALMTVVMLIVLSLIAISYGKDISGVSCSFFFGSTASCMLTPILAVLIYFQAWYIHAPIALLSIVALADQVRRTRL